VRTKLLALAALALALSLSAPAFATSSSHGSSGSNNNITLYNWNSWSVSFQSYSYGSSNFQEFVENAISTLRTRGITGGFFGGWYGKPKPPKDAGYVPEPGAVGVFSVGLLVAAGLIRTLSRKS
jgi:hypothetical protein